MTAELECSCPNIMIGSDVSDTKNWNPYCEEHGTESDWWNSPIELARRKLAGNKAVALQQLAAMRRRGEVDQEEARGRIAIIDWIYETAMDVLEREGLSEEAISSLADGT